MQNLVKDYLQLVSVIGIPSIKMVTCIYFTLLALFKVNSYLFCPKQQNMKSTLLAIKPTIVLILIVLFVWGCSQKTNVPPAPPPPPYDGPRLSYLQDIAPIMERSCAPCHYPAKDGRKEPLDTYTAVKDEIKDVLYRVQLSPSHFRYMPYKSKKPALSDEEIQLLKDWARSGFNES